MVLHGRCVDMAQDSKLGPILRDKVITLLEQNFAVLGHPSIRSNRTEWAARKEEFAGFIYVLLSPLGLGNEFL